MADALTLLGMGLADEPVGMGPIVAAAALGAFSGLSMTLDAAASASEANRLTLAPQPGASASTLTIAPFAAPLHQSRIVTGSRPQGGVIGLVGQS